MIVRLAPVRRCAAFAALVCLAAPAAAELPLPVRAMLEAAIATGDAAKVEAVADVAKITNPDNVSEINELIGAFLHQQAERAAAQEAQRLEAIRQAGLLQNWSGRGQIGAFQSSGNSSSLGITTALTLQREGIDWSHRMRLSADYQRNNGVTSREQFQAAYEPRYQMNRGLFAYGLTQFERDRFQRISARYDVSGGLGYNVIDTASLDLSIKAGPAWRQTRFTGGGSESSLAVLVGADFDWAMSDRLKLTQDANVVTEGSGQAAAIIDGKNTSLNLVTGLEAKVSNAVTTRLSYTVEYDSNPPPNAVSTDTLTRFTLIYGF